MTMGRVLLEGGELVGLQDSEKNIISMLPKLDRASGLESGGTECDPYV